MTREEFAQLIGGCEYGHELTKEHEKLAKDNGLLIVFGASDDLIEFRGAWCDEAGCYDGGHISIGKTGLSENKCGDGCPYFKQSIISGLENGIFRRIKSFFGGKCDNERHPDYENVKNISWTYETDMPHSTFTVLEDGQVACIGMVIDLNEAFGD